MNRRLDSWIFERQNLCLVKYFCVREYVSLCLLKTNRTASDGSIFRAMSLLAWLYAGHSSKIYPIVSGEPQLS